MKKMICTLLMAVLLTTSMAGCDKIFKQTNEGKIEISAYEKIQAALIGMDSYQSAATVKYISNKGANQYDTLQQCKTTGEYRITVTGPENVAGNITINDGKIIAQFNPKISGKISVSTKESSERSEIMVTSFMKNYATSQEVSVTVGSFAEGTCTILEAIVPGNHPYLATEKLWVDNKTLKPVQLVVYDQGGAERIIVTYSNFEYNVALEDNIFKAQ